MVLPRWLRGSIGVMTDCADSRASAWHVTAYASFDVEAMQPLLLPDRQEARSAPRGDNRTQYSTRRCRASRARRSPSLDILGTVLVVALVRQASGISSIPFSLPRPFALSSPPATSAGGNSGAIGGKVRLKHALALGTHSWRRNGHPHVSPSPWEEQVLRALEAECYFRRFAAGALLDARYARDNVDSSSSPSLQVVGLAADLRGTLVPEDRLGEDAAHADASDYAGAWE